MAADGDRMIAGRPPLSAAGRALRHRNFRLFFGGELGFDDIDLASLVMPALTTVAVDKALMGRAGFALLAHRLEVPVTAPIKAMVMTRLIERESVAAPRSR
jgi:DNA-binding LacI/PurR family transcriptional regulator